MDQRKRRGGFELLEVVLINFEQLPYSKRKLVLIERRKDELWVPLQKVPSILELRRP